MVQGRGHGIDAFRGLQFAVVAPEQSEQVLLMRRAVYAVDWPGTPREQVIDALDTVSYHLAAYSVADGSVVGAARIVPFDRRPFDLERYVTLSSVIPSERAPAEIGRLCIRKDCRRVQTPFVGLGILKLALLAANPLGITDFLLTALPKLRLLYKKAHFSYVGVAFQHPTWGHVDVMRLDIQKVIGELRASNLPSARILLEPDPLHFPDRHYG